MQYCLIMTRRGFASGFFLASEAFEELTHLAIAGGELGAGVRLLTRLDISELSMDQEIAGVQICSSDVFQ
jgi:hypothetical protein